MSVKQQPVTVEQFWEMPDPPDSRIELVDGQVADKPPLGVLAALAKRNLLRSLADHIETHDLGILLPGHGCVLGRNPDQVRIAEIAYFAPDRVPEGEPKDWFWEGSPTIMIEIVSHVSKAVDVHRRVHDFLDAGSLRVWVVWPESPSVTCHLPDGKGLVLGPDAMLDGGDVLPGFSVRVGDLFESR